MNRIIALKRCQIGIGVILTAGVLSIGSYGQDSLKNEPADISAKKDEKVVTAEKTTTKSSTACTANKEVTVGYGKEKKENVTGSVATVQPGKVPKGSIANVLQTLQGRAAGVNVTQSSGAPGRPTKVRVRGVGTLNNNDPLYVVDGVPMQTIDHLNPNDVEEISILKDASETAIYGTRGANGVVLVTTKAAK